jgi:DNA-binding CsgD family transcriptional regulator
MNYFSKEISDKIETIVAAENLLPSVIIIHNIQRGFTVEYMSERGLKKLGVTNKELREMGLDYHPRFFNTADSDEYVPKMKAMLERNDPDEVFTLFQQVRSSTEHEWEWYLSSTRILALDESGLPFLTITLAVPIDPENHITQKVERLLEENIFMRNNYERYASLSKREKDVLKQFALMKSNKEIADELFLSVSTVETHKRNIKKKLDIRSGADLALFARAFDLTGTV